MDRDHVIKRESAPGDEFPCQLTVQHETVNGRKEDGRVNSGENREDLCPLPTLLCGLCLIAEVSFFIFPKNAYLVKKGTSAFVSGAGRDIRRPPSDVRPQLPPAVCRKDRDAICTKRTWQ